MKFRTWRLWYKQTKIIWVRFNVAPRRFFESGHLAKKKFFSQISLNGFKRYFDTFLSIFSQKNINEILRSSKKSHFHDQRQFKGWFICWLWEFIQNTVELSKTAWRSQINCCKNNWLLKWPRLSKLTVIFDHNNRCLTKMTVHFMTIS